MVYTGSMRLNEPPAACFYCGASPAPKKFSDVPERAVLLCERCFGPHHLGGVSCAAIHSKLVDAREVPIECRASDYRAPQQERPLGAPELDADRPVNAAEVLRPGTELAQRIGRLPEDARADVERYVALLEAGPLDREVLGREEFRLLSDQARRMGVDTLTWPELHEDTQERYRARGEHLFRLGAATGDSPLRKAVRALRDTCEDVRFAGWRERQREAMERVFAVFAQGPEPLPVASAPQSPSDPLAGHGEELLARAQEVKAIRFGGYTRDFNVERDQACNRLISTVNAIARDRGNAPPAPTWTPAEREALHVLADMTSEERDQAVNVLQIWPRMRPRLRDILSQLADELDDSE